LGPIHCGGPIGKRRNKICFRKNCDVSSHKLKPKPEGYPEDDMVFICAPGGEIIYSKPAVPASQFGDNIERYLAEERRKESWETLITALSKCYKPSKTNVELLSERLQDRERALPEGVRPLKKGRSRSRF